MLVQGSLGSSLSPNFADSIVVPDARSYSALITSTAATVQLVTPYKDLFIARGLPSTFLDRLSAQASTLSQAMQASGIAKRTRVSATTDLRQLFQELRHTMRVLHINVIQACKEDRVNGPAALSAWENAKRIRKGGTLTDIPFVPIT